MLGWQEVWRSDDGAEVAIGSPAGGSTNWLFNRVADAKTVKNRLHADLRPPKTPTTAPSSHDCSSSVRSVWTSARPTPRGPSSPTRRATSSAS